MSYKLNFSAILPISYIYSNPLFSIRLTKFSIYWHNIASLLCQNFQHLFILVMPNNTLSKMFFKNLFTCFFVTWILATCSIVSRWRGWSLCYLFHSYNYESLFMSMYDKQNAVVVWPAILSKLGNYPVWPYSNWPMNYQTMFVILHLR